VTNDWEFPSCVPWSSSGFASLVTIAGRFDHSGGAEAIVERIGRISALQGIRYWSKSKRQWRTFIEDAYALSNPDKSARRSDFSAAELRTGDPLVFFQEDNTAGKVVYRLRVHQVSQDRIVFSMENASTVKKFFMTILHPADAQTLVFLDRESDDVWRAYLIMRISDRASGLATRSPPSSINRALAYYRHYAGIRTDKDPPAAR
jgi:hypothetical protein